MAVQPVATQSTRYRLRITDGGEVLSTARTANADPVVGRFRGRRQGRAREVSAEDTLTVWIGSSRNWREHAVTLDQMSAAVMSGRGVYSALCGERFVPLPMLSGPCPRCHRCLSLSSVRSRGPRQAHGRLWVRWSTYRRSVRQALSSIAPTERPGL